jgi:site-specific DNA recombinase
MKTPVPVTRKLRCAVYTRKSSEEGLEQEFNSLDAQREACEAYVTSQRAEGWVLVPDRYDDGGISGATLERPALKRLLADIEHNKVDVVVVYKIDRLSRALMDFAKLVEVFDRNDVTFVSVTQAFNTTTSMGRLTLNILLSFAQFEREVIGERIRDKFAASRRKGIWMGGWAPLGYDIKDRKLVINEQEAKLVRSIFTRFARGTPQQVLIAQLAKEGALNKNGKPINKSYIYRILNNRVYLGDAMHKGTAHPSEHTPTVDTDSGIGFTFSSAAARRHTPSAHWGGRQLFSKDLSSDPRARRWRRPTRGRAVSCTVTTSRRRCSGLDPPPGLSGVSRRHRLRLS